MFNKFHNIIMIMTYLSLPFKSGDVFPHNLEIFTGYLLSVSSKSFLTTD